MNKICNYPGCVSVSAQRCSRCKEVYYCSADHQKMDWGSHKTSCTAPPAKRVEKKCEVEKKISDVEVKGVNNIKDGISSGGSSAKIGDPTTTEESGKRQSRCMFCGEELVLESEDDAIDHMKECPALQEQLASSDQFTIPKALWFRNRIIQLMALTT